MRRHIQEIPFATFNPSHNQIAEMIEDKHYVVFSGTNNCGKSLLQKALHDCFSGESGILPVNRFTQEINLNPGASAPTVLSDKHNLSYLHEPKNLDGTYYDLGQYIRLIPDDQRDHIFAIAKYLLGSTFEVRKLNSKNSLSDNLVFIDGKPFDQASTGSRLILRIVCDLADSRIERLIIDEPELGLSPENQQKLYKLLADRAVRAQYFPQLRTVIVATHSHIFLDRNILSNNFSIARNGAKIDVKNVTSLQQLQEIQFRFIGENLENFWLPSLIAVVEGKTDHEFINAAIRTEFSEHRILVVESRGDVVGRVRELGLMIGGLAESAYSGRTVVILDSVHNKSNSSQLITLGVSQSNIIIWSQNGIEYFYPPAFLAERFKCSLEEVRDIQISNSDNVEMNGITVRKSDLSKEAAAHLSKTTKHSQEFGEKLLDNIRRILGIL